MVVLGKEGHDQEGQGESALDLTMAALTRAGELDQDWAEEFDSDVGVLRAKLDILRQMINGQGGPVPDSPA